VAETFWLWNVGLMGNRLSFFATKGNVGQIASGTAEMVADMLATLGAPDAPVVSWKIAKYFRSDWHAQYARDEPGQTWEDIWMSTWEVVVELAHERSLAGLKRGDSNGTYARDLSGNGEEMALPCSALIVADFDDPELARVAARRSRSSVRVEGPATHPGRLLVWMDNCDAVAFATSVADEEQRWRRLGARTRWLD